MKKIKEIFTAEDLTKFRESVGFFLEGDNKWMDKKGITKYSHSINTLQKEVEFSISIARENDKSILEEVRSHLVQDIVDCETSLKRSLEDAKNTKKEIKVRQESLKILEKEKTLLSFFKSIIKNK